jgi:succinyl-CoA synthetase alpha subunit
MGHAGAIVDGKAGTAQSKKDALRAAGVSVAETAAEIGSKMAEAMGKR